MKVSLKDGHTIAESVARKFSVRCPSISFDDLYQQAWVGILSAANYDSAKAKSGLRGYLYKAAYFCVAQYCSEKKTLFGGIHAHNYKKITADVNNPLDIDDQQLEADNRSQERRLELEEAQKSIIRFIMRLCAINKTKAKLYTLVLAGELKSRELADMMSVDVQKVYATTKQIKTGIKENTQLRELINV